MKQFWNCIRNCKQLKSSQNEININSFAEYFEGKFAKSDKNTKMLSLAEKEVDLMYSKVRNVIYRTDVISERMIKKYINLLSILVQAPVKTVLLQNI